MAFLAWTVGARYAAEQLAGRALAAVAPVGASGVQLRFQGLPPGQAGLRLDTLPEGGAVVPLDRMPARLRGGRGAWPALSALAARELVGRRIDRVVLSLAPLAVRLEFEGQAALSLLAGDRGARLVLSVGEHHAALPPDPKGHAAAPRGAASGCPPDELARRLREAAGALPPADPGFVGRAAELSGLSPRRLLRLAGTVERIPGVLERLADRLDGPPAPLVLVHGDEGVDLLETGEQEPAPDRRVERRDDPADAVRAWYEMARRAYAVARQRAGLEQLVRAERRRAGRALEAIRREIAGARDPEDLRRQADALLAAGGQLAADPEGLFRVPDPRSPGTVLSIVAERRGQRASERAAQLYARARKEERAEPVRRRRAAELEVRIEALGTLLEDLHRAAQETALEEIATRLRSLGVAAGLSGGGERVAAGSRRARREPAGPARVFTSPGGFEVLVGRTARQNDELTLRIARPDDLFLHVDGTPGAHVILRAAGRREVPEQDVLFAAGLAARYSSVPSGVAVDVRVARRRHVRKPRGAPPGTVTLKRSRTVRVVAP